jgi:ATP-dependent Clp protease protease subunit
MNTAPQPTEAYLIFSGYIDQLAVQRFFALTAEATRTGYRHIHVLLQSLGGGIQEGVCLYNYFRTLPIPITVYNVGGVSSAAVFAFLGAEDRVASTFGAFMIHRAHATFQGANSDVVQTRGQSLIDDDRRAEAILKAHIQLSDEQWQTHRYADLWLTAEEAVAIGLATRIGEFSPPPGTMLHNVLL